MYKFVYFLIFQSLGSSHENRHRGQARGERTLEGWQVSAATRQGRWYAQRCTDRNRYRGLPSVVTASDF